MAEFVRDVLYIKTIERSIGRKLDELDLEAIAYGEPIFVQDRSGVWASYVIPIYKLPHDLISTEIDIGSIERGQHNPNVWAENVARDSTHFKIKIANIIKATYNDNYKGNL